MTKFLELFICPVQDKIVRGTDVIYLPDAENPERLTGRCSLCNAAIKKPVIYRDKTTKNAENPRPTHVLVMPKLDAYELLKKFDGHGLPGTDSAVGTPEKPTGTFWASFVDSIRAELSDADKPRAEDLAVIAWYGEMSKEQRKVVLERFRDTGKIRAGKPRPTHINTKSAPSAAERKAEQIKPDEKVYRLISPPRSRESEGIQRKIEEKEARYLKYLDDLAENDPEAYGKKNLDIYDVAALISKEEFAEFEALIKKRNELMARPTFVEVKQR
jgi:hypothetical protein